MRSYVRGILAVILIASSIAGCSGSSDNNVTAPNNPPPPVPPVQEVLTLMSYTPANGAVISLSQGQATATVPFTATVVDTKTGPVTNIVYFVNGNPVPNPDDLSPGKYPWCYTATAPSGMVSSDCSTPDTLTVTPAPLASITCKVVSASPTLMIGAEYIPQGMMVYFGEVGAQDSVQVKADGDCSLSTRYATASAVRVSAKGDGVMGPFMAHVPSRFFGSFVLVGVPRNVTIPSGVYSGQVIPIDLNQAYTIASPNNISFYERAQAQDGSWAYRVSSHKAQVKWAFFQDSSMEQLTSSDSVTLQAQLDSENKMIGTALLGTNVFAPTTLLDVITNFGTRVYTNPADGTDEAGEDTWGGGDLTSGVIIFAHASDMAITIIPQHEAGHVLGFGHTCSWDGIMQSSCTRGIAYVMTAQDVAYIYLMYRARDLERKYDTRFSLAQDHQGQRIASLGASAEEVVTLMDANGNPISP